MFVYKLIETIGHVKNKKLTFYEKYMGKKLTSS